MKFEVGKKLEPFCCDTICQDGVSAEDLTEGMPTMFLFLRYYGCRICQLDLRDLDLGYEAVRQAGGFDIFSLFRNTTNRHCYRTAICIFLPYSI